MPVATTVARRLIELACHAPSVHNSQPWLWRVDGDRVLLYADRRRQLLAEDPDGRNLVISAGTALHHLQYAARAHGLTSTVARCPRPWEPDLLAVVRLVPGVPLPDAAAAIAALRHRCTDRRRFTSWPVPADVLEQLAEEAREWDTEALAVTDPVARFRLELISNDAGVLSGEVRENPSSFRTDMATETRDRPESGDGVIVLGGPTDDPLDWLRTGEGLSALWLRATRDGMSVVPLSLPVEVTETRQRLTETVLQRAFIPHVALRIGWQAIGRTGLPRTSRRPLDDVLLD